MSSASPRKSIDSLASGTSTPSLSQPSVNPLDSPRVPPQRTPLRRGSTASSVVSIGGALDLSNQQGSIAEAGQNGASRLDWVLEYADTDIAISSLLQPPIVRTGLIPHTAVASTGYKPPSARDIPPVTLTNIPHVESKAFQPYLSQVGSLYDVFQQAKESAAEQEAQSRGGKTSQKSDDDRLGSSSQERRPSVLSTSSRATSPYDARGRRRSSGGLSRGQGITPLATIPPLYFEEDFHLENPRTFDVVSEKSEIVRPPKATNGAVAEPPPPGRKVLATNAILQEKLSWYMDTVEIHLISSISTASKSFFTALGSLRELHSEASDSVKRIQVLRRDLQKIDREMALGGLKIVNLRRRRENIRMLSDAVSQLCDVVESVSRCEQLIDNGNIEQAADGLEEVERLMAGKHVGGHPSEDDGPSEQKRRVVDLRGIKALEGASDDLKLLRSRIGAGYESRFLNELLGDLRQHVESVPSDTTLRRWGSSFQRQRGAQRSGTAASPAYVTFDDQLRSRLLAQLTGLARTRHTAPAATSFKTAVLREMKGLIRKYMPSSSEDDTESMVSVSTSTSQQLTQQEKSSILARNLRAMDSEDAYNMLSRVYTGVSESLRRLSVQVKILLDIASGLEESSTASSKSRSTSPDPRSMESGRRPRSTSELAQDEILQILDMSSLLGQAVDIAQSQITKVLKVRSEQASYLPKEDFLKYFTLNKLFADECEAISGRSGTTLKTVVGNQIRDFIVRFGESQRHGLVEVMDSDRWDARDFGDSENSILTRILDASTKDIEVWTDASKIWLPEDKEKSNGNGTASVNGSGKDKIRTAEIDEQKYIVSESAVAMMQSIEDFQFLMANIPNMMQDIASGLLESLKLFNSRSSQLILGAGATRSAGLKNITTKHLALSSQSLSFIIALVPYIREFVRRHATSSPLMGEFDRVKRLYQEHQSGIHEKLVDIMGSRSSVHVNAMKKIDWDAGTDSENVSPYMDTLAKETATLHRVLSKHLPDIAVTMIMGPVFKSYREQWTKAFEESSVKTDTGKQRMQRDAEHFQSKLSKIEGFGDLGERLLELVRAKSVLPADLKEGSTGDAPAEKDNEEASSKKS